MKNKIVIFLFFITPFIHAQQPGTITLDNCLDSAVKNYPNYRQLVLNRDISDLNIKSIKTGYYPVLDLNAQAHYQSDVTKVPDMFPDMPGVVFPKPPVIANDWYKISLDIQQMIYDGGLTSGKKGVELAQLAVSDQKIQVELYKLKERVNTLFFNIIFLKKNIDILTILEKNLNARIKEMDIAFNNGLILSSEVDALRVELYTAGQKVTETNEDMQALIGALNELTAMNITSADELAVPDITIDSYEFENNRPEYTLFSLQQQQVMSMKSMAQVKRRPVFRLFGQAGYGRPGYDMLDPNFDDYYMIGIRMHWNIWDWGSVKRDKQVFDIQNSIINLQKETFNQNLRADLYKRVAEIKKFEKVINTDQLIVDLQQNVVNTADNQLKNGTITSTTYLIEMNKLVKANLNLEAHKLQLEFAKYQYLAAIGNL